MTTPQECNAVRSRHWKDVFLRDNDGARRGNAMRGRTVGFALGMMIAALGMTDRAQAGSAGDFTVGIEPSYFAGRYGTSHMIHIYDLPLSVAYQSGPLRLRIE